MTKLCAIDVHELAGSLPEAVKRVAAGQEFVVMADGQPVARLVGMVRVREMAEVADRVEESAAAQLVDRRPALLEGTIAQLVSSSAMRRVLAVFVLNPAMELHQREIARRSGAGLRSVQLALKRLVAMGLVGQRRDGNRLYYRAVRSEPFEQVRELLAREFGIVEVIARHLASLERPVQWAFIFGSAASGQDRIGSDIDLLVVTDATDDELVAPIAAAQRELSREIDLVSYRPSEFARKRSAGNHFLRSILEQSRVEVIGSDHDA